MRTLGVREGALLLLLPMMFLGCEAKYVSSPGTVVQSAPVARAQVQLQEKENSVTSDTPWDRGLKDRAITEKELLKVREMDPELGIVNCWEILSRLNAKDTLYISGDIRSGQPLKVPNDFRAYKSWTPLPKHIDQLQQTRKLILIVKDIPFLGCYERGNLIKDTIISVGKEPDWTALGIYKVEEKYVDHVSRSYSNEFGQPAWMPYAMRIYDTVYIHAGDVAGGHYSRGCIYVPFLTAEELFWWADPGTPVMIIESVSSLDRAIRSNSRSVVTGHSMAPKEQKPTRPASKQGGRGLQQSTM